MKNKIKLLLTAMIPLLILNCSGKVKPSKLPHTYPPITSNNPVKSQANRPSLGTPIKTIVQNSEPIKQIPNVAVIPPTPNIISRPPTVEQIAKHGVSHFSKKFKLPRKVDETSGLIKIDNRLWTLNDSGGKSALYQIDEQTGRILKTLIIKNAYNRDWEDIAYDDTYVYIGDFGNNRGNRKDLKIYKIPRSSLHTSTTVRAETIHFFYSDQKEFKSKPQRNNYDCEAMVAYRGKLYLFSKNWQNQKTRLYELTTRANTSKDKHKAQYISKFNIDGMVTGASLNKELNILLLSTYSSLLNVKVWAFTNFKRNNFFNGDAKRLKFKNTLNGQVEGITFIDNYKAYMSSESFKKYIFSFDATLYSLDFSGEFE